ncbi:MAG: tetratricopeptide repeat protein [Planctomycetota bacterium]
MPTTLPRTAVRRRARSAALAAGLPVATCLLAAVVALPGCKNARDHVSHTVDRSVTGTLDNFAVHRNRGYEQYRAGDYANAAESFRAAADRSSSDVASHYWWAVSLINLGQYADAQLPLEQAWAITDDDGPYTSRILDRLAEVYFQQGRSEELYTFLDEAIVRYGRQTRDYARKAFYLTKSGDLDGAKLAFIAAANFAEPGDAGPYVSLADFFESVGENPKARVALRYAYFIDPEFENLAGRLAGYGVVLGPAAGLQPVLPLDF